MSDMNRGGRQLAEAMKAAYARGLDDYHMEPMLLVEDGAPVGKISDHDAVVFCCRRGEREIELTEMFTEDGFDKVDRRKLEDLYFVIMTMYHDKFKHLPIAFAPSQVEKPLAQILSEAGKTQLHCAESEKFAHVTFFFNGGENKPFPGEDDICIPSPKGIDFDQKPELSLPEVADTVVDSLGKYDFLVTNFANGDVIGHTRNTEAKLAACSHVSRHLEQVVSAALEKNYVVAITADHGNIEKLYNKEGKPDGAHTTNPVPFILIDPADNTPISLRQGGTLQLFPFHPADGRLLVVAQPQAKALDVEVNLVTADLIGHRSLGEDGAKAGVCLVPGFLVARIGLPVHAPLGPAGVGALALQGIVAQPQKNSAGRYRGGRRAAEDGLRVFRVGHDVLQGAFLIVLIFLCFVNDQQVKPFAQAALAAAGSEVAAAAAFAQQDDALKAQLFGVGIVLVVGFILLRPQHLSVAGSIQHRCQPSAGRSAGGGAVGGVQNALAVGKAVQLAHHHHLVFTVSARHRIPKLGVHPQAVLVHGKDVIQ